ncbi:long-chain fatty alcohol dehydrogenase [Aspergillus heteromorphus CBS 117.55]|uniref:Long-chain-alcohol oxidase n=1 Tax=Aspergillus heteromorphus CBS 117.55 TaxID=1448321 RepID=A0A317WU75_9EURO|nr:long-chain fatty alcohol dehydrogenase [Aspergillus heteromorphus CBS 117.55]PWY89889.1 long-chain fatty alcohol dehydrogenase [Aspergillus heteromorphus CBS 117.55]
MAYVPLDVPLPPVSSTPIFTGHQWVTLMALADTVIPSIRGPTAYKSASTKVIPHSELNRNISTLARSASGPGSDATTIAIQYLEEDASSNPHFREALQRVFSDFVPEEGRYGLSSVLTALNSRAGSLLLTGSVTLIQDQPIYMRERIFRGWETSRLRPMRAVYRALSGLFKRTWVTNSPTLCPVLGFPRVPVHGKPADGFKFSFVQLPPAEETEIIETDVVIIGSGCGGSVAAKNLAEAGHKVLVVDKSYHYASNQFPMNANEGFINMFEAGGAVSTDDGCMAVLAGSTWGGGGTINWSASLQPQRFVREEWANSGLPFFTTMEFQRSLDRVSERMGVSSEHIKHNKGNRMLLEGSRRLGYAAKAVPQNTGGNEHYCGYCTLGCHSAGKKGPTETFLADAATAGAVFMEGFRADRVIFAETEGGKAASGVEGTWTSRDSYLGETGLGAVKRKVIIKAQQVVVSCGTLQSPLLLLRSGLRNPHIGRHLHLHPVAIAAAVFDHKTRPWEGAALTSVVNEFENLDGHGHGAKIEALSMLPAAFLPLFPWRDGLDFKLWAHKLTRMAGLIMLARDRDTGRVYPDPVDGRCRIAYTVSPFDRKHIVEALAASAKIMFVSGAREIHTTSREIPPFIRSSASDAEDAEGVNNAGLQAWIAELRHKRPLNPERTMFASAHQMGTCRMGKSPKTSVVDSDCGVWGTQGLYVVDASVFPSASGVNPMITNMAIADWASRNIARSMRRQEERARL